MDPMRIGQNIDTRVSATPSNDTETSTGNSFVAIISDGA
jgi:hypothetical protein